MKFRFAAAILVLIMAACLVGPGLRGVSYREQYRDSVNAAPSARFPLGADDLGRDRLARLLYGARVSLILAPAAALLATLLAGATGALAALAGGWVERLILAALNVILSLPWLFLLLTVRATLPLNVSSAVSVALTFLLLALLGWAAPARIVCAQVREIAASGYVLAARAAGCPPPRLLIRHIAPNLRAILAAQFWTTVPVFLLSEANLGILGMGVSPPVPSLGSLLRELANFSVVAERPAMLAPLVLLVVALGCCQAIGGDKWEGST